MDHSEARDLISADLDGQLDDRMGLEAHLSECAECQEWQVRAESLTQRARRVAPGVMPASPHPHGFLAFRWVRFALGWAGVLLIVWNTGGVIDGGLDESIQHLWRHQHAFGVALGITFLLVAWRPDRAYGLVPVAATFAIALGLAAAIDLANGSTPFSRETKHIVEIVGLVLLWILGWSAGPGRAERAKTDRS